MAKVRFKNPSRPNMVSLAARVNDKMFYFDKVGAVLEVEDKDLYDLMASFSKFLEVVKTRQRQPAVESKVITPEKESKAVIDTSPEQAEAKQA